MKYFTIGLLMAFLASFSTTAYSQHRHWHHSHFHNHHRTPTIVHRNHWVAPAIIGGVVTYALTRPYISEQPAVVQIPQNVVYCTEWKEVMQPNGTILQERTCTQ